MRIPVLFLAIICFAACPALAQTVLKEVKVKGTRERRTDVQRTAPTTTVDRERMDRWQASTVFEAANGIAGVSLEGGPRASGTTFNIRGFGDSEDVLIKLDGAQKNFEKYRFGGTFIEPEMLKTLSITRGPDLLTGAGALGGTVNAVTRDTADLLQPGHRVGARVKVGTGTVNNEMLATGSAFARPVDQVDLLVSAVRRTTGNYTLADGSTLAGSSSNQSNLLFKGSVFPAPGLSLSLSSSKNSNSGREAFDATGGQPGLFGYVTRFVDDSTYAFNTRYEQPGNRWIDFTGVIGRSLTNVNDLSKPGESIFANAITGNVNDYYAYDVVTVDLKNTSRPRTGSVASELTIGLQGISNQREALRFTSNPAINDALYPGGYNPAQPSGTRDSIGLVAIYTASWGPFSVAPGIRRDYYSTSVVGPTQAIMEAAGESSTIKLAETTGSLALTYRPAALPWVLGYRYVQAFRPPLLDEAFTRGGFSRCIPFFLGSLAPPSGACGSLYQPQQSDTQEFSLTFAPLSPRPGLKLEGRAAAFVIDTRQTLSSIQVVAPGVVGQPGWEHREGIELEGAFATRQFFGNAAYTRIDGEIYDGRVYLPLYTVPGNTLWFTLGTRSLEGRLEYGLRYRHVSARTAVVGLGLGNRPILGTQEGYDLLDFFVGFRPTPGLELRIALDNALNEPYFLNGFGGAIGSPAPGRNLRISMAMDF